MPLECEVKGALGSITMNKASGGDRIPVELFQILKDDAVKALHSTCPQIWKNSAVATGLANIHFHSNPKEKQCQKCSKYCTVALISHVSKVMLKILQAKLQKYMTKGFKSTRPRTSRPSSQILKRQRNQRSNCQYLLNHNKSKRIPEKTSTSA